MPEVAGYGAIKCPAGIGIPVLAALNAAHGEHLGFFPAASVALLAACLPAPRHLFLAGGLVAFDVLTITWAAPRFGIGNSIFFVLLGQLMPAAATDHFGLFGARIMPPALIVCGIFLTQAIGRP